MCTLANSKRARLIAPANRHIAAGFEMHLDAVRIRAIQREVAPIPHVEIRAQQAVQIAQHVQVERRRHTQRIVVGSLEPACVLDEVDTDQHAVTGG